MYMYRMTKLNHLYKIEQIKSFKHLIKLYLNLIQKLYIYERSKLIYINKFKMIGLKF